MLIKLIFGLLLLTSVSAFTIGQIHTAWTGNSVKELIVSFVTPKSPDKQTTIMKYGTSPSKLDQSSTGHNFLFGTSEHIFRIHNVVASNLKPNTQYYYKVGDGTSGTYSDVQTFVTKDKNLVYAVYGDFGYSNDRVAFKKSLQALVSEVGSVYDAVIHVGDFAYDLDTASGKTGDEFMNAIQPIAARIPGNHEANSNFSHYINRFSLFEEGVGANSDSGTSLWYSFDMDTVHFVGIDTEVYAYSYDPVQVVRQLAWLEADLMQANSNRNKVPWIIVYGHKGQWMDKVNFTDFEDLLHKYGVDLYICGHQHNYQRFYPFYQDQVDKQADKNVFVNPKYVVTLVVGSPGCKEKISTGEGPKDARVYHSLTYGFGHLQIPNSTHLLFDWEETGTEGSTQYSPKDKFVLIQNNHRSRI